MWNTLKRSFTPLKSPSGASLYPELEDLSLHSPSTYFNPKCAANPHPKSPIGALSGPWAHYVNGIPPNISSVDIESSLELLACGTHDGYVHIIGRPDRQVSWTCFESLHPSINILKFLPQRGIIFGVAETQNSCLGFIFPFRFLPYDKKKLPQITIQLPPNPLFVCVDHLHSNSYCHSNFDIVFVGYNTRIVAVTVKYLPNNEIEMSSTVLAIEPIIIEENATENDIGSGSGAKTPNLSKGSKIMKNSKRSPPKLPLRPSKDSESTQEADPSSSSNKSIKADQDPEKTATSPITIDNSTPKKQSSLIALSSHPQFSFILVALWENGLTLYDLRAMKPAKNPVSILKSCAQWNCPIDKQRCSVLTWHNSSGEYILVGTMTGHLFFIHFDILAIGFINENNPEFQSFTHPPLSVLDIFTLVPRKKSKGRSSVYPSSNRNSISSFDSNGSSTSSNSANSGNASTASNAANTANTATSSFKPGLSTISTGSSSSSGLKTTSDTSLLFPQYFNPILAIYWVPFTLNETVAADRVKFEKDLAPQLETARFKMQNMATLFQDQSENEKVILKKVSSLYKSYARQALGPNGSSLVVVGGSPSSTGFSWSWLPNIEWFPPDLDDEPKKKRKRDCILRLCQSPAKTVSIPCEPSRFISLVPYSKGSPWRRGQFFLDAMFLLFQSPSDITTGVLKGYSFVVSDFVDINPPQIWSQSISCLTPASLVPKMTTYTLLKNNHATEFRNTPDQWPWLSGVFSQIPTPPSTDLVQLFQLKTLIRTAKPPRSPALPSKKTPRPDSIDSIVDLSKITAGEISPPNYSDTISRVVLSINPSGMVSFWNLSSTTVELCHLFSIPEFKKIAMSTNSEPSFNYSLAFAPNQCTFGNISFCSLGHRLTIACSTYNLEKKCPIIYVFQRVVSKKSLIISITSGKPIIEVTNAFTINNTWSLVSVCIYNNSKVPPPTPNDIVIPHLWTSQNKGGMLAFSTWSKQVVLVNNFEQPSIARFSFPSVITCLTVSETVPSPEKTKYSMVPTVFVGTSVGNIAIIGLYGNKWDRIHDWEPSNPTSIISVHVFDEKGRTVITSSSQDISNSIPHRFVLVVSAQHLRLYHLPTYQRIYRKSTCTKSVIMSSWPIRLRANIKHWGRFKQGTTTAPPEQYFTFLLAKTKANQWFAYSVFDLDPMWSGKATPKSIRLQSLSKYHSLSSLGTDSVFRPSQSQHSCIYPDGSFALFKNGTIVRGTFDSTCVAEKSMSDFPLPRLFFPLEFPPHPPFPYLSHHKSILKKSATKLKSFFSNRRKTMMVSSQTPQAQSGSASYRMSSYPSSSSSSSANISTSESTSQETPRSAQTPRIKTSSNFISPSSLVQEDLNPMQAITQLDPQLWHPEQYVFVFRHNFYSDDPIGRNKAFIPEIIDSTPLETTELLSSSNPMQADAKTILLSSDGNGKSTSSASTQKLSRAQQIEQDRAASKAQLDKLHQKVVERQQKTKQVLENAKRLEDSSEGFASDAQTLAKQMERKSKFFF